MSVPAQQHREDDRGGTHARLVVPLRIGTTDVLQVATDQSALALTADAVLAVISSFA
jgi:hypothetical protein